VPEGGATARGTFVVFARDDLAPPRDSERAAEEMPSGTHVAVAARFNH
jgi:hypothetical protein